jgi:F-type H+-transporting ATPase subunit delta
MNRNRVTVRYAKALIELATEQNVLEEVDSNIRLLYAALDEVKSFNNYICNTSLNSKLKLEAAQSTFGPLFNPITMRFLHLIFTSRREEFLKDICRNFIHTYKKTNGIVTAKLTTAVEIDKETVAQIMAKFEQKLKTKLEYSTQTNPELLGGFVFTIDGQQYDASLTNKIRSIKSHLNINN